jgi:flagellar basal body-associated protein FliL
MSARHVSGTKLVLIAVTTTLTALGIATIYLPFYADRDKLRGMHEEADANLSEKERREIAMLMAQMHEQQNAGQPNSPQQFDDSSRFAERARKDNSMWARMKQSSADRK